MKDAKSHQQYSLSLPEICVWKGAKIASSSAHKDHLTFTSITLTPVSSSVRGPLRLAWKRNIVPKDKQRPQKADGPRVRWPRLGRALPKERDVAQGTRPCTWSGRGNQPVLLHMVRGAALRSRGWGLRLKPARIQTLPRTMCNPGSA